MTNKAATEEHSHHGRRLGWMVFKIAFAVALFGGAIWLLRHELEKTSVDQIMADFRAIPLWRIGLAIAATVLSYVYLGASEWWALEMIGRKLATWRILLVTIVSYTMSNGLGFSLATGGAARLRFYRSWGFRGTEIAAVTLLAGIAVTLSGFVTVGLALQAVHGVPLSLHLIGLVMLAPAWLWLGHLPKRVKFLPGVELLHPPLRTRVLALSGGILDWILSGLALLLLMPSQGGNHIAPFLAVFVLGSVISAASGVPGGIGVFEAVVLTLSRHFALPHQTAAALVLYRLIYAIGPLFLTASGLAIAQFRATHRHIRRRK
jgi:phosphatidylglycerol lysyltransferase